MKRSFFVTAVMTAFLMLGSDQAKAQPGPSNDLPKFEVGADFSTITFEPGHTELGLGGRLTYNLNKHVALEGAGFFFPRKCDFCGNRSGRITEGLFGVKVGKRFERWGIFGKVRPGVMSFSEGKFNLVPAAGIPSSTTLSGFPFDFKFSRLTAPVVDVGGVVEFYPSKHIVTRLDFGNTIIHYLPRTFNYPVFNATNSSYVLVPTRAPSETRGSLQFSAGVGFRF